MLRASRWHWIVILESAESLYSTLVESTTSYYRLKCGRKSDFVKSVISHKIVATQICDTKVKRCLVYCFIVKHGLIPNELNNLVSRSVICRVSAVTNNRCRVDLEAPPPVATGARDRPSRPKNLVRAPSTALTFLIHLFICLGSRTGLLEGTFYFWRALEPGRRTDLFCRFLYLLSFL